MLIMGLDEGWTLRARIWASLSLCYGGSQVIPACQTSRRGRGTLSSVDILTRTHRLTEEMVVTVLDR